MGLSSYWEFSRMPGITFLFDGYKCPCWEWEIVGGVCNNVSCGYWWELLWERTRDTICGILGKCKYKTINYRKWEFHAYRLYEGKISIEQSEWKEKLRYDCYFDENWRIYKIEKIEHVAEHYYIEGHYETKYHTEIKRIVSFKQLADFWNSVLEDLANS